MTATSDPIAPDPIASDANSPAAPYNREADELLRIAHGTDAGRAAPYPLYRRMREIAPFYRSELDGMWYVTGYADTKAVLLDPRAGRAPNQVSFGVRPEQVARFNHLFGPTMLMANPPEHTRLRGLVSKAFTYRRTSGWRDRIRAIASPLVDALAGGGPRSGGADLIATVGLPLPVAVVGELVGVPPAERGDVCRALAAISAAAADTAGPDVLAAARRGDVFLDEYFADLARRRRADPADDLLSALIAVRDAASPGEECALSEEELVSTSRLLFLAGFGTTTHLIGNGLLALLRHPDQRDLLWADPGLAASAAEEMLRYDSPVQFARRIAIEPFERHGLVVGAGEEVVTLPGAANRDPARFADPDAFDIRRADNAPLSLGWGIHHCLGAPLARLELQVLLELLVERYASLELADPAQPDPSTSWFFRRLEALPVRAVPR